MLQTDLLLGDFETVTSVYEWGDGALLRMAGRTTGAVLVLLPHDAERAARELETLHLLRTAGVPECRRTLETGSGGLALLLDDAADARPLALIEGLPEPTLRAGLTSLLSTVDFAHSRGLIHGRIDRSRILADPSGRFWLTGWAGARPASESPPLPGTLAEAATDLRDLARAFREALLRRPWPDPDAAVIHERAPRTAAGQELLDAGVKVDRDFARVLSRLVTSDPREAYSGATDVLADLSAVDATAFDPWERVPPVGTRREIARVLRFLDHTRLPTSEQVMHAASVDYVAPDGAGKSRLLAEIARVARSRNVIVITAEGGARGPWGGVGAIARQLVQLVGRGARPCVQHEDALRSLLDEHAGDSQGDSRSNDRAVRDGRDPLTSACTSAVSELVRFAFRETPGLLVLDDEDALAAPARQVWRSTGQFVQAINGVGGAVRALLVSASSRTQPAELGVDRVTVELRPWRQRDLDKFLARVFTAPGGTRDAGVAIHRITGGRPGDVIGYLRELERRGVLVREGLRWRAAVPITSIPPLSGGMSEQVRRAIESCGRDAASLVECLAVARDVTLSRTTLGDLFDVRGPRLAAAADAAVAAGLLATDGSAWRIRTGAIAHKVYAAIPSDRRRVLHREILNHLLDVAPGAIDAIAEHARASADPRADAWTKSAIERARAGSEWLLALRHFDDAVAVLGGDFVGADAELRRIELLAALGRLGEVIEALKSRQPDEYTSLESRLRATLYLTRAYYEAREWQSVVDVAVPDTAEAGEIVAEIRFNRAAALRHLGRGSLATREARLAAAEVEGAETDPVALTRLEHEYQTAFYGGDWNETRRALVAKVRIGFRMGDTRQIVRDMAKLGNAARVMVQELTYSHAVLVRAVGMTRRAGDVGATAKSALYGSLGYTCGRMRAARRAHRHFGRSSFYAAQSGAASVVFMSRLRLVSLGAIAGRATYEDKRYLQTVAASLESISDSQILSVSGDLGLCLLYYGRQAELECLSLRISGLAVDSIKHSLLLALVAVGKMWFDEAPESIASDLQLDPSPRKLIRGVLRRFQGDTWTASISYCALRPEFRADAWLQRFVANGGANRLAHHPGAPGWGAVSLALGLALWIPIEYDAEQWKLLVAAVRSHPGPLPVALEWQRVLMESREFRRLGDWRRAQEAYRNAVAQLDLLLDEEYGERGAAAHARWKRRLLGEPTEAGRPGAGGAASLPCDAVSRPAEDAADPESWTEAARTIASSDRSVLVSPFVRELERFLELLRRESTGPVVVRRSGTEASAATLQRGATLVLLAPNLWTPEEMRSVRNALAAAGGRAPRVVTLLTVPLNAFRAAGSAQMSLSEAIDGAIASLEPICGRPDRRPALFASLLRSAGHCAEIDAAAAAELTHYAWPGGLAEIERVAGAVAARRPSVVTARALEETGWKARVQDADSGLLEDERRILRELAGCPMASIGELSARLGRPSRTLLRYLDRLQQQDRIVRLGRGRATRYRLRQARGQSST